MKNWLPVLAAVSILGAAQAAETKKPAKPAAAKSEPAAKPAAGPRIVVEPATHDFGTAAQNKTLTKEFTLKNAGTEELVVGDVSTTCGCTVAQLSTKTLKPGDSTPLVVNLETRTAVGKLERLISIPSNDPAKKILELKVTANVTPPAAPSAQ